MADFTWSALGDVSANLAGTALDAKATGTECGPMTYNNSANYFYAIVTLELGSITPTAGGSVTLKRYGVGGADGVTAEDIPGGGETYPALTLKSGTGAKRCIWPMVRIYPGANLLTAINNSGATTAGSGNALYVRPYSEAG